MEDITFNDNDISLNLVCNVPVIKKSGNKKRQQTKRTLSKPTDDADIGAIDDKASSIAAPQQETLQPSSVRIQAPVVKSKDIDTIRTTPNSGSSLLVPTSNKINSTVEPDERAKYMAQYHARPLEMDRRANAMLHIRPSHSSTRIFETNTTFEQLGVNPRFVPALTRMSFHQPTSIQRDAIPKLLASSTNNSSSSFCIQCETGSGKTIAYILPILQSIVHSLEEEKKRSSSRTDMGTRAIIICPTRELATQTFQFTSNLLQHSYPYIVAGCLSGGEKRKSEKAKLRKGITILFATPGRLLDHFTKTECFTLSVKKGPLSWFVLDEVDRLLDMGLKGQIQEIVQRLCGIHKLLTPNWKSILVSATFPPAVLTLAKSILGDEKVEHALQWSTPNGQDSNTTTGQNILLNKNEDYSHAAPHQLSQLYMVVSSKLRLAALTSFLVARVKKGHSVIVFLSTCDSVDFHHALFTKMKPIVSKTSAAAGTTTPKNGIFGTPLLKLHGNINPTERQQVLQKLCSASTSSYILFATDVAARGLNLGNQLDWIVQYDAPCEVTDYVHRVGRSARAGNAGHAILFLLPTEQEYVTVLKSHGLGENMTALSLSATLQTAAKLCPTVLLDDINNSGDGDVDGSTVQHSNNKDPKRNRLGEEFAAGILRRFEECVLQDGKSTPKDSTRKRAEHSNLQEDNLLSLARQAFRSYIRAYPTKEKSVRHIFSSRALHLGHVARSFALKESPIAVGKTATKKSGTKNNTNKRDISHFAFDHISSKKQMKLVLRNDDKKMEGTGKATSAKQLRQNKAVMISAARQSEKELGEFG